MSTTTEIVPADAPAEAAAESTRTPSMHQRLTGWTEKHLAELPRFVTERPPALTEHLAYARRGEWTTQLGGPARRWHLAWTRAVALPVTAAALLLVWATARPGRFVPLLVVATFLATALNTIPVLHWFVPDWASWTAWPPVTWFGG